jgi:hypothetical protein
VSKCEKLLKGMGYIEKFKSLCSCTRAFLFMNQQDLIPHLFRTEFRKITAVLCKYFGIEHVEIAEDIARETFLSALETWTYKGIPEMPTAWLYSVAKNKAKNYVSRHHFFYPKNCWSDQPILVRNSGT